MMKKRTLLHASKRKPSLLPFANEEDALRWLQATNPCGPCTVLVGFDMQLGIGPHCSLPHEWTPEVEKE